MKIKTLKQWNDDISYIIDEAKENTRAESEHYTIEDERQIEHKYESIKLIAVDDLIKHFEDAESKTDDYAVLLIRELQKQLQD